MKESEQMLPGCSGIARLPFFRVLQVCRIKFITAINFILLTRILDRSYALLHLVYLFAGLPTPISATECDTTLVIGFFTHSNLEQKNVTLEPTISLNAIRIYPPAWRP